MKFTLNKPFETDQATVDVDPGLAPGPYRFRLVVISSNGERSKPTEVVVTILDGRTVPPVVAPPVIRTPIVSRPDIVTPVIQPSPIVTPVEPITPLATPATPRRPRRPTPPSPP